jgi:hypothetical protein
LEANNQLMANAGAAAMSFGRPVHHPINSMWNPMLSAGYHAQPQALTYQPLPSPYSAGVIMPYNAAFPNGVHGQGLFGAQPGYTYGMGGVYSPHPGMYGPGGQMPYGTLPANGISFLETGTRTREFVNAHSKKAFSQTRQRLGLHAKARAQAQAQAQAQSKAKTKTASASTTATATSATSQTQSAHAIMDEIRQKESAATMDKTQAHARTNAEAEKARAKAASKVSVSDMMFGQEKEKERESQKLSAEELRAGMFNEDKNTQHARATLSDLVPQLTNALTGQLQQNRFRQTKVALALASAANNVNKVAKHLDQGDPDPLQRQEEAAQKASPAKEASKFRFLRTNNRAGLSGSGSESESQSESAAVLAEKAKIGQPAQFDTPVMKAAQGHAMAGAAQATVAGLPVTDGHGHISTQYVAPNTVPVALSQQALDASGNGNQNPYAVQQPVPSAFSTNPLAYQPNAQIQHPTAVAKAAAVSATIAAHPLMGVAPTYAGSDLPYLKQVAVPQGMVRQANFLARQAVGARPGEHLGAGLGALPYTYNLPAQLAAQAQNVAMNPKLQYYPGVPNGQYAVTNPVAQEAAAQQLAAGQQAALNENMARQNQVAPISNPYMITGAPPSKGAQTVAAPDFKAVQQKLVPAKMGVGRNFHPQALLQMQAHLGAALNVHGQRKAGAAFFPTTPAFTMPELGLHGAGIAPAALGSMHAGLFATPGHVGAAAYGLRPGLAGMQAPIYNPVPDPSHPHLVAGMSTLMGLPIPKTSFMKSKSKPWPLDGKISVPPPQPQPLDMAPPPPPASKILDTPDVLPQPTPPTAPLDARFGAKRYPTQVGAGAPSTEPLSSRQVECGGAGQPSCIGDEGTLGAMGKQDTMRADVASTPLQV